MSRGGQYLPDRFQAHFPDLKAAQSDYVHRCWGDYGCVRKRGAVLILHIFSDHSQAPGDACTAYACSASTQGGAHLQPRPAPPAVLTHLSPCKRARTGPRAPAHPATPSYTHQLNQVPPLPEAPSRQPRNTPGLPLARLRARTRTHALLAPPHREGAQASGGGEPRAESWVHPALGFRAEAPGWRWFPEQDSWRWKQFTPLSPPRDPYTSPRAASRSQEQTRRVNPQLRPGAASQLRARSRLEAWRLDF